MEYNSKKEERMKMLLKMSMIFGGGVMIYIFIIILANINSMG